MNEIFNRYAYWKILTYFLKKPSTEVYVRELARILEMSPASTNAALNYFYKLNILNKAKRGPAHFYSLNNDIPLVQAIKKMWSLFVLEELDFVNACINADPGIITLAIYGSFANGTFDEKSDFDILIVGGDKAKLAGPIKLLEKKLGYEVNIERFSLAKWQNLKEKRNVFYSEVARNHVLLSGVSPI